MNHTAAGIPLEAQTGAGLSLRAPLPGPLRWRLCNPLGETLLDTRSPGADLWVSTPWPGLFPVQVWPETAPATAPPAWETAVNVTHLHENTALGMLSLGSFDFVMDGAGVHIRTRLGFSFAAEIPEAEQRSFERMSFQALRHYWSQHPVTLRANAFYPDMPLRILPEPAGDRPAHKLFDVSLKPRREMVIRHVQLNRYSDPRTVAHEYGHVLGLYDEYDGGWLENLMFWHDNRYQDDTAAMMNVGSELRPRYYAHFLRAAQDCAPAGVRLELVMG